MEVHGDTRQHYVAFADDGSSAAHGAETVLSDWPIFGDSHVSVISVAEVAVPLAAGFTPGPYDQVLESYAKSADDARAGTAQESKTATERPARATASPTISSPRTESAS